MLVDAILSIAGTKISNVKVLKYLICQAEELLCERRDASAAAADGRGSACADAAHVGHWYMIYDIYIYHISFIKYLRSAAADGRRGACRTLLCV